MPMVSTAELPGLEQLLNRCFPVPEGSSFYDDFPVWDPVHDSGEVWRFGARSGDRLVASTLLRAARLKTLSGRELRIGLLGGVSTDPGSRGQGLASSLVEEAVAQAQSSGLQLLLLWGSEHSLYERLGFHLSGRQIRCQLQDLPHQERPRAGQLTRGFTRAIFEKMRLRGPGILLTERDWGWMSSHRNVQWWAWEIGGQVAAYAAMNRGIDLQGFVHEWHGPREALAPVFAQILREQPDAWLLGPRDLTARLEVHPVPPSKVDESLALIRILDSSLPAALPAGLDDLWIWGLDAV